MVANHRGRRPWHGLVVFLAIAVTGSASSANASTGSPDQLIPGKSTYRNCENFNEIFPSGVARTKSEAKSASNLEFNRPIIDSKIYASAIANNSALSKRVTGVICATRLATKKPGPVFSAKVFDTGIDRLTLTWSPYYNYEANAPLRYEVEGAGQIEVKGQSAAVTGLAPGTFYTFKITAVNAKGRGPVVEVSGQTNFEPLNFVIPSGWEPVYPDLTARFGTIYGQARLKEGDVRSLGNAPSLRGSISASACSGEWFSVAGVTIEFLDSAGAPVSRNAVIRRPDGRDEPNLELPSPSSVFGPSRELRGYFPSTSSRIDSGGCGSGDIDLSAWQRATQIRIVSVTSRSGSSLVTLSAKPRP